MKIGDYLHNEHGYLDAIPFEGEVSDWDTFVANAPQEIVDVLTGIISQLQRDELSKDVYPALADGVL